MMHLCRMGFIWLYASAYPQREFAEAVLRVLQSPPCVPLLSECPEVLDIACGSGATTWHLAQALPCCQLLGVDMDANLMARAAGVFRADNLRFEVADLYTFLRSRRQVQVCCLLNVLFLLEDATGLLGGLAQRMTPGGVLVCIVPNVASRNFREFERLRPRVNVFRLHPADFGSYFGACGWEVMTREGIVFQRFYGLIWPKLLGPFRSFVLRWLHGRRRDFTEPCYYALLLRKT